MRNKWGRILAIILTIVMVIQSIEGSTSVIHVSAQTSSDALAADSVNTTVGTITTNNAETDTDALPGAVSAEDETNTGSEAETDTESEAETTEDTDAQEQTIPEGTPISYEDNVCTEALYIYSPSYLEEDLVVEGDLYLYDNLQLNQHKLTVQGKLYMYRGQLIVDGDMELQGESDLYGGSIVFRHGTVYSAVTIYIRSSMQGITMTSEDDKMQVQGNFCIDPGFKGTLSMEAGMLELSGDYLEIPNYSGAFTGTGIVAGENFVLQLTGEGSQMIDIQSENTRIPNVHMTGEESRRLYVARYNTIQSYNEDICDIYEGIYRIKEENYQFENKTYTRKGYYYNYNAVYLEEPLQISGYDDFKVYSDFYQGADFTPSNYTMIEGNYYVAGMEKQEGTITSVPTEGILNMTANAPTVNIYGDFVMNSEKDHTGALDKGCLNIYGSFYQYGEGISNFVPGENFAVQINAAEINEVYMQDTQNNWFTKFYGTVTFLNEIQMRGEGAASIEGTIRVKGEDLQKVANYTNCAIHLIDDAVLNRNIFLTSGQELILDAGLDLNGYSLYCKDLTIPDGSQGHIILNQETSELYVTNNFYTGGLYSCDSLTQGKITFYGDVTQKNMGIPDNFVTREQVQVVLCASGRIQNISFDSPESGMYNVEVKNGTDGYVRFLTDVSIENLENTSNSILEEIEGITGYTLTEDTVLEGDLCLSDGIMDLNGYTLTVKGNVILAGGTLKLQGGTLHAEGNLRLQQYTETDEGPEYGQGYGILQMTDENEVLQVDGSIYDDSVYTQNLTNGRVILSGDFISYAGRLSMGSNSTLILNGTEVQRMCAEKNTLSIYNLKIQNDNKLIYKGSVLVKNSVEDSGCAKEGALYVSAINVLGDTYRGDVITGNTLDSSHYRLTKDITIQGDLELNNSGRLDTYTLQADTITVNYECLIEQGTLKAEALNLNSGVRMLYEAGVIDAVDFNVCLKQNMSYMKAGTLYIRGSFAETGSTYTFAPSGTHKTVLDLNEDYAGTPTVQFSKSASRFQTLQLNTELSEYDTNRTIQDIAVTVIGNYGDAEAPDTPGNLYIKSSDYKTITLAWDAAEDNDIIYKYHIYQDDTLVAATSDCSYTVSGMTQNETHTYKVYALDISGNSSVPAVLIASTKEDVTAPGAVKNFQADSAFTGSSVPLTWKASTDDGMLDHYNLYRDNKLLAEVTGTAYTDTSVTEGTTYTYTIEAVDWAGNCSAQAALTITPMDPPDAADFEVSSKQGTITISFNSDGRNVSRYDLALYKNNRCIDIDRFGVNDTKEYSSTFVVGGARELYTCKVTVTSSQGQSVTTTKTIYSDPDTTPPELTSVTGLNASHTVNGSTTIIAKASDNCGVSDICIEYAEENSAEWTTLSGTGSTNTLGIYTKQVTWNPTGLTGYYKLRITVIDTNKNTSAEEYTVAVNYTGLDGVTIEDAEPQLTSVQLSWNCTREEEVGYYQVECMENDTLVASTKVNTTTAVVYGLFPDKDYTVRVVPYTKDGERGLAAEAVVHTLYDDEAPVISGLTPGNSYVTDKLTLTIEAADNAAMEKYEIYSSHNQETWELQKTYTVHRIGTQFSYSYSQSVTALEEGAYYIKVIAYDTCGNASEPVIQNYIIDHTCTGTPTELTGHLSEGKAILSWRAPMDEDVKSYVIYGSVDGGYDRQYTAASGTSAGITIQKNHVYTFYVMALDKAGNVSDKSDVYEIDTTKDTTAPSVPENPACYGRTGSSIYLKWSASTDDIEVSSYNIYRNGVYIQTVETTWYQDTGLTTGKFYDYTVTAVDWNGNESDMSEEITASTAVTKIENITPENYATLGNETAEIQFLWTKYSTGGTYQATVEYSLNGADWTVIEGISPNGFSQIKDSRVWNLENLEDGEYQVRIRISDPDGNESSILRTYYVDRQAAEPVKQLLANEEQRVVSLTWDKSISEDLYGYYLYRRSAEPGTDDTDAGAWEQIAQIGKAITFYMDSDVTEELCYQYGIVAYDSYMQESSMTVSEWIQVSPDDIAPEVISIQPAEQVLSGTAILTITGQDNRGVVKAVCEYYDAYNSEWKSIGRADMTENTVVMEWNTSELHGRYKIRAIVEDAAGNQSESYEQYYDIDNVGIAKIQNLQGTAHMNSIVLSWDEVKEDDFAYFSIEQLVEEDYIQIGTETSVLGHQIRDLDAETEYTFRVVGYDLAGNRGEPSDALTITTGADEMLPVIKSIENAALESTANPSELALRVYATDNIGIRSLRVEYSLDEETWIEVDRKEDIGKKSYPYFCKLITTELPEGTVYIRAIAEDMYGNQNDPNQMVVEFDIDHTAPEQVIGLNWEEEEGLPILTWNPVADSDIQSYHVVVSDGKNTKEQECKSLYYEHYNSTPGTTYTYQVYAIDTHGNKGPLSETISGICSEDTIAPQILSLTPLNQKAVCGKVTLSIMAKDNVAVQKLYIYYRSTIDSEQDYLVQELKVNGNGASSCNWDTTGLEDGTYQIRIQAVDAAGNRSDWYVTEYIVDNTAPERGVLLGVPGNYQCYLSWEAKDIFRESVTYELYRKTSGETTYQRIYQGMDTDYTDGNLDPAMEYAYVLRTLDEAGNYTDSYVTYLTPYDIDDIPPMAYVTADSVTVEGYEIVLDGIQSTDNQGIASFFWDFGDGTTGSGAKVKHIYKTSGTYTATLTVTDKSGNTDTDTAVVKVLKNGTTGSLTLTIADAGGNLISGASVYAHTGESENDLFLTDEYGQCRVIAEPGTYQVAVFKNGYVAQEVTITVHLYEEAVSRIILQEGSIVSGDLTVRKLSFEEMVDAGIDISAPENQHIYAVSTTLTFEIKERQVILVNDSGYGFGGGFGGSSGGGSGGGGTGSIIKLDPPKMDDEEKDDNVDSDKENAGVEENPNIVIITVSQEISWLKEMYEAKLTVYNNAGSPTMYFDENVAELMLPKGISLAKTVEPQYLSQSMDIIRGGQSGQAVWYLKGDTPGTYTINATYNGTFMPFGQPASAEFESNEFTVSAGEGLVLYIMPEDRAEYIGDYYVYFVLRNEGDSEFYNVKTTFGGAAPKRYFRVNTSNNAALPLMSNGDYIAVSCLEPGEEIRGYYTHNFSNIAPDADDYTYYLELVQAEANIMSGANLGVKVVVSPIASHINLPTVLYQHPDPNQEVADPIDSWSGAYINEQTLLSMGEDGDFNINMKYNSRYTSECGEFGYGWVHNYESRLVDMQDGTVRYYTSPNAYYSFQMDNLEEQEPWTIDEDGYYVLDPSKLKAEQTYTCYSDSSFELQRLEDWTYVMTDGEGTTYTFSQEGSLTSVTSLTGRKITLERTAKQVTITDTLSGRSFTLHLNSKGLVEQVTDSAGRSVHLYYDEQNRLTIGENALGERTYYTYDSENRILTASYPDGTAYVTNTYDSQGRVLTQDDGLESTPLTFLSYSEDETTGHTTTRVTNRLGGTAVSEYDASGNLLLATNEKGECIQYTYDNHGNNTMIVDANGNQKQCEYDKNGNLICVTESGGTVTNLSYDKENRLISSSNSNGEAVYIEYDDKGQIIRTTDQNHHWTSYTYNEQGQVIMERNQSGAISYEYNGADAVATTDRNGHTIYSTYDTTGRIVSVSDGYGTIKSCTYDALGRVQTQTNASGGVTTYTYDTCGKLRTVTGPDGGVTTYEHNNIGWVTRVTDAEGGYMEYSVNSEGWITAVTDSLGRIRKFEYDAAGNMTAETDADGNRTEYTYDGGGNVLSVKDSKGAVTTYSYYPNGKLAKEVASDGTATYYTYEQNWRISNITSDSGAAVSYEYDAKGNLTAEIDALGNRTSYTYDAEGNVTAVTDPMGNITRYTYDSNGNVLTIKDALRNVTKYTYDDRGRLTKITLADGSITELKYDEADNIIQTIDPMGNTISYAYDNQNNCIQIRDGYDTIVEETTYDLLEREVTVADALGNLTYTAYDTEGQVIGMTQTSGEEEQSAVYAYDRLGRITQTIDSMDAPVGITYDEVGNITSITDAEGGTTKYQYDSRNNLTEEENAIGAISRYSYNAMNLLEEAVSANGDTTTYEYDALGRITSRTDEIGTIHYTYDKNSNLLTVEENGATIKRTYDALNRVTSYTDYAGRTIQYGYDEVGNLITLTYAGGEIVRYEYNPDGSLEAAIDSEGRRTEYAYDRNSQLLSIRRADGSVETYSYDAAGRLTGQTDTATDGTVIQNLGYSYDGYGNITAKSGFDTHLDISALTDTTMEYDEANRLIKYNGKTVKYDRNGNMTYGPLDGVMTTFTYDCRNRLIKAGGTTYTYDAENNRIASTTDGVTTEYLVDSECIYSRVLEEYQNHEISKTYIYGNNNLLYEKTTDDIRYHHYDNLGSTTALTGQDGSILASYSYDTYGKLLSGGTGLTNYLYNGAYGVQTDENGLYYMRARYYNTDISRFINQDILRGTPSASQSLNRYAYCQGNPVNQADPFGLCPQGMTGRDWAHLILGIVGCIPYVGIVANVVNAVLYFQEGDALSGILCIAGAAIGVGGIMAAASGAACAVKTVGLALKTAGTAYVATTMVRETVENAEITLDLLYENGGELNGEVLMSAAQTVLCGVGAVAGFAEVGKCISTASALSASGMACFVAGTQVLTIDGMKNIEDVEVGDYVYSTNEETGESDYKEVLQVFEKETEVIEHLYYENAEGETKEIETTINHPFWCEGEWKAAGTLKEGDALTLADGSTASVIEITYEDRHTTVYNMEVADYHTYYVGEDSVWVHNKCGTSGASVESGKKPTSPNQMQNQVEKGQAPKGVDRVDSANPNTPDSQPHIHFGENEAALNFDGTWHDAGKSRPTITNKIEKWILKNGWNLPKE